MFRSALNRFPSPDSPYAIDHASATHTPYLGSIFFDGVFKGDYSLAIVNRHVARAIIKMGGDLSLHSPEAGWQDDHMLNAMPDLRSRFVSAYPPSDSFDIHIRNTWPPRADDMIGRRLNAYVCFAWEEQDFPSDIVAHFNAHLDLVMVTSKFVEDSLKGSGVTVPITVVGNGTDHIFDFAQSEEPGTPSDDRKRILHVSSCFPRKGADLLVDAFLDTFTGDDDVSLCIKTFDNPHNTIEAHIKAAQAKQPNSAQIEIIKRSMSYPELISLLRSSSLLVAPSRGEGFGLPLAEAMLLGIPVVTTGYSGQTDFCTSETAWLIDYTLVPSAAHVSKAGALWAEPSVASLSLQMKRALDDHAESREKVKNAQALLRSHFKWSDVARRVLQSLGQTVNARADTVRSADAADFRIDLVSTWNQVCGIATYSEHLFDTPALRTALKRVLARELRGDEIEIDGPSSVSRAWGYDGAGVGRLETALSMGSADVVWLQHHPGFFSDEDMTRLSARMRRPAYRMRAITFHNVHETIANRPATWLKDYDVIIVHTARDAAMLAERGVTATIIPHGILAHGPAAEPRDESAFTIGTFGFLNRHKNVPVLIEALAHARRIEPRLRLKLLTCVRSNSESLKERVRVEALVAALGVEDAVEMDFNFLDDADIISRLGQCDVLCFPYGDSSESATGAGRIALAADRPLLCSQSSVLSDILPLSLVLPRVEALVLADAMLTLSASASICALRDAERRAYVARHSYPVIAQRHRMVFESFLKGGR